MGDVVCKYVKERFGCRDFPFGVCKDITIGKDYYEHPYTS